MFSNAGLCCAIIVLSKVRKSNCIADALMENTCRLVFF